METRFLYKGWDCKVEVCRYSDNDRIAIKLVDDETYEPIAVATINVPEVELAKGVVVIKNYSENEGMLIALRNAGIVEEVIGEISLGFVTAPVCKLSGEFLRWCNIKEV